MTSAVRPEDIEAMVEAFQASGCAELHIRFDGFELRLSADGAEPAVSTAAPAVARPAASASNRAPAAAVAKAAVDEAALAGLEIVRAPYLGTFYRAPKPGEPAYVEVGSEVEPDSDLCLVEVMKLFTAVRAGVTGVVAHILAADGAMVETGQPLFAIKERG